MAFDIVNKTPSAPVSNGAYIPNPKIARLWEGFKTFAGPFGLTPSQWRFAEEFFRGSNLLLTGSAGTGKSYILKALFDFLTKNGVSVGKTGTTGVCSFNIGGQTIHSFAGLGLADEHLESLIEKIGPKGKVKARLKAIDVLFIDEISMAKGDLLDKLDGVLKHFRRNRDPWGGVQILASGDFLQLPPVFKGDEKEEMAFQCKAWKESNIKAIVLREIVRQQGDPTFAKILNEIRVGDVSNLHVLDSRVEATWTDSAIEPVRVFCRNVDVDLYNRRRLEKLTTQSKTYMATDTGLPHHVDTFNKNCPAPQSLELKVGAQVMLLVNMLEEGFFNGSVGIVKSFTSMGVDVSFPEGVCLIARNEWSIKEQIVGLDGKIIYSTVATRRQIPLRVCYSVTAHKIQGATLDRAIVDMEDAFASGQAYCALSRVRTLDSLSLATKIPPRAIKVNQACLEFYQNAQ